MRTVHELIEGARRNAARLDIAFFQRTDKPRFFALQHRRGKQRLLQHARENRQRLFAFRAARQRTHAESCTIGIEAPADAGANVRRPACDFVFVHALGAEPHDVVGHARHTCFFVAIKAGAGSEINRQIEHRYVAVLHKINARATGGLPVLNRQDRQRRWG